MFLPMSSVWLAALCLACTVGSTSGGSIRMTSCPTGGPQATYRWVVNPSKKQELWVEGAGSCVTLSDIYQNFDEAPLVPMNSAGDEVDEETGTWLLTESLFMESGTTLLLHDDLGCEELRLISSSSHIVSLRSHGAYISLLRTKVFSWNRSNAAYATTDSKGKSPRSYLSIVSEMIHSSDSCDGAADDDAGEARMDIINSEVGYLGYQAAEAYGISYKVRGYCKDKSNPEVFDRVNVRGDIRFSDIHHNWFGMYSYGHQDGLWEYNHMHDSGYYGFDPHDDSDNLRIHNNLVYDNGNHGIIASKRCNDVSIQNNEVYDSAGHGIMLHRSSDNAIVRNNTVVRSGTACIALFESYDIEVSGNVCQGNEHGIRLSLGSSDNKIFDNQILNTNDRALWLYVGSDAPEASEPTDGRPTNNLFQNNHVENSPYGVVDKGGRGSRWIGNTFLGIEESQWEDADGTVWKDNTINSDTEMKLTDTCVDSSSDRKQIEDAGGDVSTC